MNLKNKNLSILFTVIVVVLLTGYSCKDYLDLNPASSYNVNNFYNTPGDFNKAINGDYSLLRSLYNFNLSMTLLSRSDNVVYRLSDQYDWIQVHRFTNTATNSMVTGLWEDFWKVIKRSNLILKNIKDAKLKNEEDKAYIEGQAYFLRGYSYFYLGFLFGGVPLIDKPLTVGQTTKVPRSTQSETFKFASNDLDKAANSLPGAWPSDEAGRATKYSAEGIHARFLLFQKKYQKAKPLLEDIIKSGKYHLANKYSQIFLEKNDNGPEAVFSVQYKSGQVGQGNSFVNRLAPQTIDSPLFPFNGRSGFPKITLDLYNTYEKGDLRRDFSIQKGYSTVSGAFDPSTKFFIKYAHGNPPTSDGDRGLNLPVLRYTDVKLMYAEILNENSYEPGGESFTILNNIRNRAGLNPLTSKDIPSQDAFRKAIFQTRRLEFAGEFLRWFDLVRSGKAVEIMNKALERVNEAGSSGGYQMKEYEIILPIPQRELDVNKDRDIMFQNPGY